MGNFYGFQFFTPGGKQRIPGVYTAVGIILNDFNASSPLGSRSKSAPGAETC